MNYGFMTMMEESIIRGDMERILEASDSVPLFFLFRERLGTGVNPLYGYQEEDSWGSVIHASCMGIHHIPKPMRLADGTYITAEDYDAIMYFKEIPDPRIIDNETVTIECNGFQWKPVPMQKIKNTPYNSIFFLKGGQLWNCIPVSMNRTQPNGGP